MDWSLLEWEFPVTELGEFFGLFSDSLMPIFYVVCGALLGLLIIERVLNMFSDVALKLIGRDPRSYRDAANKDMDGE
jgi:hypothetical protein